MVSRLNVLLGSACIGKRLLFAIASVMALLASTTTGARAHGGGTPRLVNEPVGPYWVSVWTAPEPVRVGDVHFTVGVAEPGEGREAGQAVLGADVRVRLQPVAGDGAPLTATASNQEASNRLFYETDVTIPAEGQWAVQVDIAGPAGNGMTSFAIDVLPAQTVNWPLFGGLGAALVVVIGYFALRRRS